MAHTAEGLADLAQASFATILATSTVNLENSLTCPGHLVFVLRTQGGGILWTSNPFIVPVGGRIQLPGNATGWLDLEKKS